jgi:predicted phage terminase large subunit-like protein
VWRFKTDDGIELGTAIMQYSRTWSSDLLGVEDGQIWKSIKSNFDKACAVAKHYPSHEVIVPLTDKRTRAQPARGRMQQGKIQFPARAPWYQEFKAELLRFQAGGRHDDQVDALAHVVRLATAQAAPKGPPQAKMPESWKTKLARQLRGVGGSHMTA